jgi:hypothetical protein
MPDFFKFIDLCVQQKIENNSYKITEKANYELDLSKSYETLYNNFTPHCRRNIESSIRKKPELVTDIKPEELVDLFIQNKGGQIEGIKPRDYSRLINLMKFCILNKKGRLVGVRGSGKRLIFGIFLVEIRGSKTILFVVNTPKSRERRIGYYVVNDLIKNFSSTRTILDFAGSSIPSISSFFESFGADRVPFYRLYRNRLIWPLRILK